MCRHYETILASDHRHHVAAPEHDNCVLCLAEANGPMTLEAIAGYLGISKERAHQIEKVAFAKLHDAMEIDREDLFSEPSSPCVHRTVKAFDRSVFNTVALSTLSPEDPILPHSWRNKACVTQK